MRVLAIETATEACSVALFEGAGKLGAHHEVLGRGHAERLVPMIEALPGKGRADQIRVSLGPGSFTGTRIGIAVAKALGIAWQAEVVGYHTLQLVALQNSYSTTLPGGEMEQRNPPGFIVCMNGGHGEWFVQPFNAARHACAKVASLAPEDAVAAFDQPLVIGSRAQEFVDLRGGGEAHHVLPDASYAWSLRDDHLFSAVSPLYGRAPDAKLPA